MRTALIALARFIDQIKLRGYFN